TKAITAFIRTSKIHLNSDLVNSLTIPSLFTAGNGAMKRALFVLTLVGLSLLSGCEKSNDVTKSLEKAHKSEFPIKQGIEQKSTPEFIADHTETPKERANYLRSLSSDEKFDPKQHVDMLKKYEKDSNEDVASAAKELLAKAQ